MMNFSFRVSAWVYCFVFAALSLAILPNYPGSIGSGLLFIATGVAFLTICYARPSSFFMLCVSGFLAAGFLAKAVAHFAFGIELIEPVGKFSGQWDEAFAYASAGFIGASLAALLSRRFPSFSQIRRAELGPAGVQLAVATLGVTLAVAIGVYALNYQFSILRIGFPLGIAIDPRLYAVLSFIITWGALLGSFCLATWIIEAKSWSPWPMICLAALVGAMATTTMASRIQLLLYLLAATWVVLWRISDVKRWWHVGVAAGFAIMLVAVSHVLVSIERRWDFVIEPRSEATEARGGNSKLAAVKQSYEDEGPLTELRNLAVMRWVGLEGPMVMAGSPDMAGVYLFVDGLSEDPAAGIDGIYQLLSGDQYGTVEYYTFLTLPGPVGVASYSGSHFIVAAFLFIVVLAGHAAEWLMAKFTANIGAAAVAGVATAYITVQMGFPWTYFVFVVELVLAGAALGMVRLSLLKASRLLIQAPPLRLDAARKIGWPRAQSHLESKTDLG